MMQAYAEYKDSGVDWLGEIPAGWDVVKSRRFSFYEKGKATKPNSMIDDGLPLLAMEYLRGDETPHLVKSTQADVLADDGDILLLWDGSNAGEFLRSKHGVLSATIAKVSLSSATNFSFIFYSFKASESELKKSNNGMGIPHVSGSAFKELSYALPPLPEQTAIAGFLEDKTAKIDELVGIKRRQIALLGERKQILIQNAVTKGLNAQAPMKDSGVDWIGKIPAHWEVKPAKHLFFEVDERSKNGDEELLSVSHMTGVTPRSEKTVSMFLAEDYSGSKICKQGDLVFNIMWAWMGALGVSPLMGIVSPSYAVFRQLKAQTFNPDYLEMLMQSLGFVEHYNKVSTGLHSSRLRFYSHMFLSMKIGYPPFEEQEKIIVFLNKETGKITKAISVLENQITKLNEYKTTLINAAVTGKIKVV